jgi:putative FmdB family regulatory protein
MPIYEYRCDSCGETNEYLVFGKDEELHCKSCDSQDLKKLLSAHNTGASRPDFTAGSSSGGCCGSPNSCGNPGSCCGG